MQKQPKSLQTLTPALSSETLSLIRELQRLVSENRRLFLEILGYDGGFSYRLYEPVSHEGIDEGFLRPLIMRQIDRLLEEKQNLCTKRELLNFIISEEKRKKEEELLGCGNHYLFLRSSWTRLQGQGSRKMGEEVDNMEKLQNLNKIVGIIKNNIKILTENQHRNIGKQIIQEKDRESSYISNKICQKLRQQIERLRMNNEELESRCINVAQKLQEKNRKIEKLEAELYQAGDKIKQTIDALHATSGKYQSYKKEKHALEAEVKRLKGLAQNDSGVNKGNQPMPSLVINSSLSLSQKPQFRIKIEGTALCESKIQQTSRTLPQILDFLRANPLSSLESLKLSPSQQDLQIPQLQLDNTNPELQLQIPCLNLTSSQSMNYEASVTERQFSKVPKYIPMRTQRTTLVRGRQNSMTNPGNLTRVGSQTEPRNLLESTGSQNEQSLTANMSTNLHKALFSDPSNISLNLPLTSSTNLGVCSSLGSNGINNNNGTTSRRFSRKIDQTLPLTSDRFRKERCEEDMGNLGDGVGVGVGVGVEGD